MPQAVEQYLRGIPASDRVRAVAFDAVYNMDDATAERALRELTLPDNIKATLWDFRSGIAGRATPPPPAATAGMMAQSTVEGDPVAPRSWTDTAVDALPTLGGIGGGIIGGIGGTVAGMGVGGVPGAIGGATLGGGAGEAAKQLVNRMRGVAAPGTPLEAATSIGAQGAIQGAAEGIGAGVAGAATRGARAVYRGFLKPSISARMAPKANQIVQTALDEALPITRGGAQAGQRVINELRAEVDGILAKSQGRVDLRAIADKVRAFAKRKYFKPGADQTDYKAALDVADRLDRHPSLGIPPGVTPTRIKVPAAAANETKRALDASVGDTGFGVKTGATRTAEKFARRETRGALEAVEPAIRPLNARESKLIDATRAISQAVEREGNRNAIFGVPTIMAGAMGGGEYARSGDPASAAAMVLAARAGMHPAVASRIAIVASKMARELGVAASTAARLAVFVASEDAGQQEP